MTPLPFSVQLGTKTFNLASFGLENPESLTIPWLENASCALMASPVEINTSLEKNV